MKETPSPGGCVMVVDDEANMCSILEQTLQLEGFAVVAFTDPHKAVAALDRARPDIVLTDLMMPGLSGMAVVEAVKQYDPAVPCIIITAHGSIDGAVDAIKLGAYDYITKPFLIADLLVKIGHGLAYSRLSAERTTINDLWRRSVTKEDPVGASPSWQAVMATVARVAPTPSVVLLRGETGSGKEVVAHALHRAGTNARGRFVPINCAAIPEALLESELFGHEKGAFTNALSRKLGLFELADKGTLFLDEIGDMPLALQAKLLRVLESRRIQRLGGTQEIAVDARVVTATHRDLAEMIARGAFREDLYYRLNVITIDIPPLRDRGEDIFLLARFFAETICAQSGRRPPSWTEGALKALAGYGWPGNVRELRNVIERALTLGEKDVLEASDLRLDAVPAGAAEGDSGPDGPSPPDADTAPYRGLTYLEAKDKFEREYVTMLLGETQGNVTAAARLGAMSRRNFYEKIEKLDIDSVERKPGDDK